MGYFSFVFVEDEETHWSFTPLRHLIVFLVGLDGFITVPSKREEVVVGSTQPACFAFQRVFQKKMRSDIK